MSINKVKNAVIILSGYIIYLFSYLAVRDKKLWIFGAWFGEKYADNSKYLFEYVNRNHPEIRAIWVTGNWETLQLVKDRGYEAYHKESFNAYRYGLKAGVGILNTGIEDIIPYTTGGMTLVQLWHGTPLKKIVFDADVDEDESFTRLSPFKVKKIFSPENMFIASSPGVRDTLKTAFKVPEESIKVTGYPRNDFKKTTDVPIEKLLEKLKEEDTKVGIYMPTHRQQGLSSSTDFLADNLEKVNLALKELNSFLLVKVHFYGLGRESIEREDFDRIYFLEDKDIEQDIYTILPQTDYLVTDYSSVYFDYLTLDKPVVFLPFDFEDYLKNDRELYYDYHEVTPGPKALNWDETMEHIAEAIDNPDKYRWERGKVNEMFNEHGDRKNSKRVFEEITCALQL